MAVSSPEAPCRSGSTETSPLLQSQSQVPVTTCYGSEDAAPLVEQQGRPTTTWHQEAKTMVTWSAPLIMTHLLQRSVNFMGVFAVGRIGAVELGAVSLASITASLIGNSLIQGLATGLDTLCAQAYGSGNKHLVGLHMQRMVFFILPCVLPLMILWWEADKILVHVLPERRLAELTGTYLRILSFRIPASVFFECGKRFVQAQGIFSAATYVLLITAPLNAFLTWFLVWRLDWGFVGAPTAVVITENLMAVLLVLYIWLVDGSQCWGGFTTKAFSNWGQMIRLSLPGMLMNIAEFAVEEILTLASAQFGTSRLAAQSALVTMVTITYNIFLPVSIAASTRVAHWVGAQAIDAAKTSAKVTIMLGLVISAFVLVILSSLRHQIPLLFTQDPEVTEVLVSVLPIATAMQVFDGMATISHGLLRGIGCQELAGYFNLVAYYAIALPVALGAAFHLGWEIEGLWIGITTGLCIVSVFEFWWLYRSNWDDAAEKATRRNQCD